MPTKEKPGIKPQYTGSSSQHKVTTKSTTSDAQINACSRLFGMPYQFINSTDPRFPSTSTTFGKSFAEKVVMDAPIVYFIPGKAQFLPTVSNSSKASYIKSFIDSAKGDGNIGSMFNIDGEADKEDFRYYDFEECYTEYMKYVNIMCRSTAAFLGLTESLDGVPITQYDWKNYRFDGSSYSATTQMTRSIGHDIKSLVNSAKGLGATVKNIIRHDGTAYENVMLDDNSPDVATDSFIPFYVDPSSQTQQNFGNETAPGMIKGLLDQITGSQAGQMIREFNFLASSLSTEATANLKKEIDDGAADISGMISDFKETEEVDVQAKHYRERREDEDAHS